MKKINIDGLLALNIEEIEIVYRRCRGETVENIAKGLKIPEGTVWNLRIPKIRKILGVNDWKDIDEELCIPLRSIVSSVQALRRGWPEEFREKIEALREPPEFQEKPTSITEPTTVSASSEYESQLNPSADTTSTTSSSTNSELPQSDTARTAEAERIRRPFGVWPVIGILLLVLCLAGIAGVGFARSWLLGLFDPNATTTPQATQTPETLIEPASTLSPTVESTATDTPSPTDTVAPTLTSTPSPTMTPMPTETQQTQGLTKGQDLSNDHVTLMLSDVRYNQGKTRIGTPVHAPIVFVFDFTNHSGETLLLQIDQSNFRVKDNLGNEANCEYWSVTDTHPELELNINSGQTFELGIFCGEGDIPPQVTTYTLYVTGFSTLFDSTWVHEVVR